MDLESARRAVLEAWDSYRSDPMVTLTPASFYRWLRETRPELLEFEAPRGRFEQVKEWLAER